MTTILLIEDHAPLRENLCEMLTLAGYHVLAAENGREGLQLAAQQLPALVLCDVMMPGLDGYAVLERIRTDAATKAVPFVFLTAKGTPPDIRAGMNLGADDYLPKPVSRNDLLRAVRTRLERARQQQPRFAPNFDNPKPLEKLGISPREAEVLLWVAQGKGNHEIAQILGLSIATVKKHTIHIFEKLGVESRTAASLRALEVLS
ncbi:MAG: response regulator [Prosthecobacter sp.]|uniref:response regulator n=1 Tax=Prosthecobacter sp. TaxID=1965333 RepID=UPI0039012D2E